MSNKVWKICEGLEKDLIGMDVKLAEDIFKQNGMKNIKVVYGDRHYPIEVHCETYGILLVNKESGKVVKAYPMCMW